MTTTYHRTRPHQGLCNFKRLLAGVWLGDEQLINLDAAFGSVDRVERVFHIDESRSAAACLTFRDDMLAEGRFTG